MFLFRINWFFGTVRLYNLTKNKTYVLIRLVKWFCRIIVIILLIGLLIFIFLMSKQGEAILTGILETELKKVLDNDVSIKKFETNLFSSITLDQLKIFKKTNHDTIPFLYIGRAKIHFNILKLIKKNYSIKKITIDSLYLNVLRDSLGNFNFLTTDSTTSDVADSTSSNLNFSIQQFQLKNASVCIKDKLTQIDGCISNLNIKSSIEKPDGYQLNLSSDSINFFYDDIPFFTRAFELEGIWSPQKWILDSCHLYLSDLEFAASGEGQGTSLEQIRLQLTGNPNRLGQNFQRWLPDAFYPINGDVNILLTAAGKFKHPEINVRVFMPTLELGRYELKNSELFGSWNQQKIELTKLRLNTW